MVTYTKRNTWSPGRWKATLTLLILTFTLFGSSFAQSPCQAHRWTSGDGWRYNSSTQKWEATTLAAPSLQPKGIVRCASSAETEESLQDFAQVYNSATFPVDPSLTNCFSQQTETRGITVAGPQNGEEIVWFNFDIRPLAGTYQFQIITNDQVGWVLYYVDPQYAEPVTAGTSNGQPYPPGQGPGLSGFTGNCTTDLSRLQYADCGVSGNGWSTITVPSFQKPSNYYLAMWLLDPGTGPGKSTFSNNLIYKSRYGCGGVTCTLEKDGADQLTCSTNSYTVCATYFGSAGKWAITDNAAVKASSYTVTTYDQYGAQVSTATSTNLATNPLYLELGTISWSAPQNDIKAVICATYPLGAAYSIALTPSGTPAGAPNNYIACTSSGSFSGPGLTAPNANAGADKVLTCTTTQIALSGSSTTTGATFSWIATNGGHIVSGANTATPIVDAAGTYTLTVTAPNGCTASDVALVTLNNTAPNANAGADQVLTCTTTQIALSGSSTTAGVTYSWVASNGGHIVSGANTATPIVDAAGTYTLTVTNPTNGCTATDIALVTLNNTAPNVNAGADKVLTCTVTSIALSGSSTTTGATFSWVASNGGHIVSGANTATPTVDAAGTYTLTVTAPNGCTAQDVALVTLNNTPPNANAGADKVLTCTVTSIALSGSSTTTGATFSWAASNGGNIVSGANTATPIVNAAGTYTLTVTNPVNGCTAQDVALVTVNNTAPAPPLYTVDQPDCEILTGSIIVTNPLANHTYTLTGTGVNTTNTTGSFSGLAPGSYNLAVTSTINGCLFNVPLPITINPVPTCGETLCTYTQGQYGTEGGMACTPGGQKSTRDLIYYAIDRWPNDQIVIGSATRKFTINRTWADVEGIMEILPGGGPSNMLPVGSFSPTSTSGLLSKTGRLNNTLLAQTITLGLNMGITTNLANFELRSGQWIVTGDPLYGCNTASTDVTACSYDAYQLYGSDIIQFLYNNYWNGTTFATDLSGNKKATVAELFNLASQALGGGATYGFSYSAIAGLEDQIANIFDECQVFIGYMTWNQYLSYLTAHSCPLPPTTMTTSVDRSAAGIEVPSDLKMTAYPNPYNNTISFNFTSPVSGKALLEVYDVVGKRLAIVFEGQVDAGMQKAVNYNVPSAQRVPMIYKLSVGGKTSFGKLLPGNTD